MVVINPKFGTMGKLKSLYISFVPLVVGGVWNQKSHSFIEKSP